jgi:hypothetical protein
LPLGASHIRATVQSVTPVTRRFFGAATDCWASAAFELPRGTTPNRMATMHIASNASFRILTFGLLFSLSLSSKRDCAQRPVHATYATILPAVDRHVRGHMRNRQQTMKPAGKCDRAYRRRKRLRLPKVRDQIEPEVRVLFADVGRTWRVSLQASVIRYLRIPSLTPSHASQQGTDVPTGMNASSGETLQANTPSKRA